MTLTDEEIKNHQEESNLQQAKDLFGGVDDIMGDKPPPNMANMISDFEPGYG